MYQTHCIACHAGVIFWQWGFAPYIAEEFLQGCIHCQAIQVSSSDGVFKNIIAPAAEYAAQVAVSRSPAKGCKPGVGSFGFLSISATNQQFVVLQHVALVPSLSFAH